MNNLIRSRLIDNIALTQEVHMINHQILEIQFKSMEKSRKHWTISEDSLLYLASSIFGVTDLNRLQKILISKTKQQIYFRIRYISENPHMFQIKCKLVQQK
ncbi:Hypothetical_protein [Hexamita inflata]|uniref:Hypothetical_protein n=1 Tax=Hexamita inflata TaxID=28002 RepID=A0AA86QLN9_9EUKA|nr:Hypothetical protein HINF_LOCUS48530 [Hexamita inflata]